MPEAPDPDELDGCEEDFKKQATRDEDLEGFLAPLKAQTEEEWEKEDA